MLKQHGAAGWIRFPNVLPLHSNVKYIPWVVNQDKKDQSCERKSPAHPAGSNRVKNHQSSVVCGTQNPEGRGAFQMVFILSFRPWVEFHQRTPRSGGSESVLAGAEACLNRERKADLDPLEETSTGPVRVILRKLGRPQQSWPSQATYPTGRRVPRIPGRTGQRKLNKGKPKNYQS